jgi:hypothetical protein
VLSVLGKRDPSGRVSDARMVVRKVRGGLTGVETALRIEVVNLGVDADHEDVTSCIVHWSTPGMAQPEAPMQRRVESHELLTAAIEKAGGLPAPRAKVQAAFAEAHRARGKGSTAHAAGMAFKRALKLAMDRGDLAFGSGEMLVAGEAPF